MAAPTWLFISFMVLLSLAICSAQPIEVRTVKSKKADNHNHKAHTLTNVDVQRFGGIGSDDGFGIVGGGGGRGGFGLVGGGGFGIGIGGGGGFGIDFGSPIYIPGFDFPVYSPACGYMCPANNPSGETTEFKISGLSHFTRPYRCRPGPNTRGDRDFNHELLLHFVSTMQHKEENKQRLHDGDAGLRTRGSRRLGFGRGSGSGTGGSDTPDQYYIEDPGRSYDGCGYVCPVKSPSGGIGEFHISGLSHFNGPYRCRPDLSDTEDSGEFVSPMHNKNENQQGHQSEQKEEEITNDIPYPPPPHS